MDWLLLIATHSRFLIKYWFCFSVTFVLFSPEEHLLWSAGKDGVIKQWDAAKFERVQVLSLHSAEVRAIAQTSNGKCLVSHFLSNSFFVYEQKRNLSSAQFCYLILQLTLERTWLCLLIFTPHRLL